jgi:cellulose synthase/poly-beta-1,6-N-acetylglucosamine synthase-like glycosyltransferase
MAGPKLLLPDGQLDRACRRSFPTPIVSLYHFSGLAKLFPNSPRFARYNMTFADPDEEIEVDSVVGAYMQVRREAIEAVGLLDETFFMYGEDLDWAYRVKAAGWKVIYHPEGYCMAHQESRESQKPEGAVRVLPGDADLLPEALPDDDPTLVAQSGDAGTRREGGPGDLERAEKLSTAGAESALEKTPETIRSNRTKSLLRILLVSMDVLMLVAAFVLGYATRVYVPVLSIPASPPPLSNYLGTMILHAGMVALVMYFSRMYHQRRVISRIDQGRRILGAVTIGSMLAYGLQELIFKIHFSKLIIRVVSSFTPLCSASFSSSSGGRRTASLTGASSGAGSPVIIC